MPYPRLLQEYLHTQSCPLSKISFVLYQSPYFFALFKSAPWCSVQILEDTILILQPPKWIRFGGGGASWTVASPRVCCDGGNGRRESRGSVCCRRQDPLRDDETALGEGACRESIVRCGCAQLSETGEEAVGLRLELRYLGGGPKLQTQVIIDQGCVDWLRRPQSCYGKRGRPATRIDFEYRQVRKKRKTFKNHGFCNLDQSIRPKPLGYGALCSSFNGKCHRPEVLNSSLISDLQHQSSLSSSTLSPRSDTQS
jgi:hypothetical protein